MISFLGPLLTLIQEIKKKHWFLFDESTSIPIYDFFTKLHFFEDFLKPTSTLMKKIWKSFLEPHKISALIKHTFFVNPSKNFFATGLISLSSLLKFSSIPLLALCCVQRNRLTGNVNSHSAKHQLNFKAAKLTDANASKYISIILHTFRRLMASPDSENDGKIVQLSKIEYYILGLYLA